MKLLISSIRNPHEAWVLGCYMVIPLYDFLLEKIHNQHQLAKRGDVYDVQDFCGDVITTISDETAIALCAGTDVDWESQEYAIIEGDEESIGDSLDRLDCVTLHVHKDGTFCFQCYLKHGGDDTTLRSELASITDLDLSEHDQPDEESSFNLIMDCGPSEPTTLLGCIKSDKLNSEGIKRLWDDFKETNPECADQFIDYLREQGINAERDDGTDVLLS